MSAPVRFSGVVHLGSEVSVRLLACLLLLSGCVIGAGGDTGDDAECFDDDCETSSCVWVNSDGGYWRSCPGEDCPCANN
jgi:hypothetical protein